MHDLPERPDICAAADPEQVLFSSRQIIPTTKKIIIILKPIKRTRSSDDFHVTVGCAGGGAGVILQTGNM